MQYSEASKVCQPTPRGTVDEVGAWLAAQLWPPRCVLCGGRGQSALDLCAACEADLPINTPACQHCAQPLASARASLCGACLRRPPLFIAYAAFRYAYPVDHLIHALKYRGQTSCGRVLGALLARRLLEQRTQPWPALIIPTPLSAQRYRERGFNQAAEVVRSLAATVRISVRHDLVRRVRHTQAQAGLDRKTRRRNVRGAFDLADAAPASHIAIVDDVITTGSTARELARVLRKGGVDRVEIWAVARTADR